MPIYERDPSPEEIAEIERLKREIREKNTPRDLAGKKQLRRGATIGAPGRGGHRSNEDKWLGGE